MKPRHKRESRAGSSKRVALPTYRAEDWQRWLACADDRDSWAPTHDDWRRGADAMADRLRRAGLEVIWIELVPDELSAWCKARGYRNDTEARNRFAAERIGNIPPPPGGSG